MGVAYVINDRENISDMTSIVYSSDPGEDINHSRVINNTQYAK